MNKTLSAFAVLFLAAYAQNVNAQGTPTVSPPSLTFNVPSGSQASASQSISISSTAASQGFVATALTNSGGTWLNIALQSITGASAQQVLGITPATLLAFVNPTGLSAGTYTGSINISFSSAGTPPVNVPVTMVVSGNTVAATPASATFNYQVGGVLPPPQNIQLVGGPFNFTVQVQTASGGNWLSANASSPTYPATLTLAVNPVSLPPGQYTGTVTIGTVGVANSTLAIPVTLNVSNTPLITPSLTSVGFNFQTGGAPPASQILTLSNLGPGLNYTATYTPTTGGNFLSITPTTGTTPGAFLLTANPGTLTAGTYTGTISIVAPGAGNTPIQIPVSLGISGAQLLNIAPSSLTFNAQTGQASPASQTVNLTSTGAALNYTVSSTTVTGGSWLSVAPASGTTPGSLTVTANSSGLGVGTYSGLITVVAAGSGNGPQTIPVTLNVSASAVFNITPSSLAFTSQVGSGTIPTAQTLTIGSSGTAFSFAVATTTQDGNPWLSVTPATGTTGSSVSVAVNPTGLAAGTYIGLISITSAGIANSPQVVPVVLTVTSALALTVTPGSLTFSQTLGATAPAAQTLNVTTNSGAAVPITAQAIMQGGGNWLQVTPTSATTPTTLSVSANGATLAAGTYSGYILISGTGVASVIVPVTFTQANAPTLAVAPTTLNFAYTVGSLNPPVQTVQLTSTGSPANFTATASTATGGPWLFLSPNAGTVSPSTPVTMTISVVPNNLQPGNYTGTITINAPGATNSPLTITVNLVVSQQTPVNATTIVNAASQTPSSVSPGEIITIYGTNLGPATPANLHITNGVVDNQLGNVQVFFDTTAAPLIYVSSTQINAIVPYEIAGRFSTVVQVTNGAVKSQPITLQVVNAAPAIFTSNSSGSGQGAILNQDLSPNAAGNPAARGSVIAIYATGEGATTPQGVDGRVATGTVLPKPNQTVTATVGGVPAVVQYYGAAPQLVAGVLQVNVLIPDSAPVGPAVPVFLTIGTATSPTGVTVAIK